ncbi:MAG: class C sortase [Actinomycetaceae bacterium]|nr:class C sortase [Actinomycetaceae bacterium]
MTTVTADTRAKRKRIRGVLSFLLVVAGLLLMLYPVVATYFRNEQQANIAEAYRHSTVSGQDFSYLIEQAHAYNRSTAGAPILDPWLERVAKDNRPYQDYLEQLNVSGIPGSPMGAIAIPDIKVNLPIYHGTEPDVLERGIGHLYGSALPIGGENTHSVLTGHTGLASATLFDDLDKVTVSNRIYLDVAGYEMTYEVDQIEVVLPTEIDTLQPVPGEDLLTLVTCTPYGINSHRLLVHAHRVPNEPAETTDAFNQGSSIQWWMFLVLGLMLLIVVTYQVFRRRNAHPDGRHRRLGD